MSAWDLGWQQGDASAKNQTARKQQLTDEQRQSREKLLVDGYQKGAITPQQVQKGIDDLYSHEPQESRLHRMGRVFSRKPAPEQGPSPKADFNGIIAGQKTPEQIRADNFNRGLNETEEKGNAEFEAFQRRKANARNPEEKAFVDTQFGSAPKESPTPFKEFASPDGKQRQWFRVGGQPEGWNAQQGAQGGAPKVGSFGEFVKEAYGDNPTPEQTLDARKRWAQAISGTTVGDHMVMVPQTDGSIKVVEVQTSSHKEFGGAPAPGASKGPAPRKGATAAPGTTAKGNGPVKSGDTVGGRETPDVVKAKEGYEEAAGLAETAKLVAARPKDAVNQKRLLAALEVSSARRFNERAVEYIKSSGIANSFEEWMNKADTGALPEDVMRQIVDGVNQNLQAAQVRLDTARNLNKAPGGPAPKTDESKTGGDDLNKKLDEAMK